MTADPTADDPAPPDLFDHLADAECAVCGAPFTAAEWEDRHNLDGASVHASCCAACDEDERDAWLDLPGDQQ